MHLGITYKTLWYGTRVRKALVSMTWLLTCWNGLVDSQVLMEIAEAKCGANTRKFAVAIRRNVGGWFCSLHAHISNMRPRCTEGRRPPRKFPPGKAITIKHRYQCVAPYPIQVCMMAKSTIGLVAISTRDLIVITVSLLPLAATYLRGRWAHEFYCDVARVGR